MKVTEILHGRLINHARAFIVTGAPIQIDLIDEIPKKGSLHPANFNYLLSHYKTTPISGKLYSCWVVECYYCHKDCPRLEQLETPQADPMAETLSIRKYRANLDLSFNTGICRLNIPASARILRLGVEEEEPHVWALCNSNETRMGRELISLPTDYETCINLNDYDYIGWARLEQNKFTAHYFIQKPY